MLRRVTAFDGTPSGRRCMMERLAVTLVSFDLIIKYPPGPNVDVAVSAANSPSPPLLHTGDIDTFVKVPRPDDKPDPLGLSQGTGNLTIHCSSYGAHAHVRIMPQEVTLGFGKPARTEFACWTKASFWSGFFYLNWTVLPQMFEMFAKEGEVSPL